MSRMLKTGMLLLAILSVSACSNLNQTEQRVLSGAAIGTAGGALGTVMTGGCVSCGAVIGGAVGAASGYVYDQIGKQ